MEQTALEKKLEKLAKKLDQDLIRETRALNADQLKSQALELTKKIELIDDQKAADAKLQAAKEVVKDLSAGYKEVRQANRLKLQLVLAIMQERDIK